MGVNIWELVVILLIVVLLFGTKKLKDIGGDLGGAIKSFKSAMNESDEDKAGKSHTIDGEAKVVPDKNDKT